MHSILRFVFVVVPTAVLATAVVVGVSRSARPAAVADGDLQRDLELASAMSIELAPAGQPLATVSAIEAPPAAEPGRTLRPKRSSGGSRAARSRRPVIRAEPQPEVTETAEVAEEPAAENTELASVEPEATAEAAAPGGVALPRPTGIPVSFPPPSAPDPYDPGTVIRGGGIDPDHCQIGGRRGRGPIYGPTIFRGPQGPRVTIRDRVRPRETAGEERRPTIRDRVRVSDSGTRRTISDRVRRRG